MMNQSVKDKPVRPLKKLPMRLHHHAFTTDNHQRTRHFYEHVLGLPLVAYEVERERIGDTCVDLGYAFYELGDGSTLAFFTFDDPEKQAAWKEKEQSLFVHISLLVEAATQDEVEQRLTRAGFEPLMLQHGFCTSLYIKDPNGLMLEFSVDHEDTFGVVEAMTASVREWMQGGRKPGRSLPFNAAANLA
ncbi:VOC family protein [Paraburkholderia rhizosphaerae]|uniref:Catechol 2,3-dioxygenase-like lactoylglutathione lyase family enzyme n=1 Tax=Paraburkholderia rhizosphaerae TaxID=480658 RepID=A0A4R8L6G1_9BURK|nr:VOC family protein [Paraburkholderia rhizosphaerae]TDY37450.1 catechol 2,3-dioxygenase-like lactoylglutathione lyase family enzyme [Paraburkholderia rhizosphaerae]